MIDLCVKAFLFTCNRTNANLRHTLESIRTPGAKMRGGEWKRGGKRREDAGYSKQGFVSLTLSPSAHPTYQKTKLLSFT